MIAIPTSGLRKNNFDFCPHKAEFHDEVNFSPFCLMTTAAPSKIMGQRFTSNAIRWDLWNGMNGICEVKGMHGYIQLEAIAKGPHPLILIYILVKHNNDDISYHRYLCKKLSVRSPAANAS